MLILFLLEPLTNLLSIVVFGDLELELPPNLLLGMGLPSVYESVSISLAIISLSSLGPKCLQ
jgi:hypothetical protein